MNFSIELVKESRIISSVEIHSFEFTTDIFSLYSICNLTIKDIASQTFNIIKTGMDVNVLFTDENDNTYKNKMKVVFYTKVPGKQNSLTDYLKLILYPSFFFLSSTATRAYQGSVYNIISEIYNKYFTKYFTKDFSETSDVSRVRYQIAENSQDFMFKILKYGIIDNLPVYLYMDSRNCLNLKGIAEFIKREPLHILEPSLVELTNNEPANDRDTNKIGLLDYKFVGDITNTSSKIITKFTTAAFVSSRSLLDKVTLRSTENGNAQSDSLSSEITNFKLWNLTPDDALTISIKENFENCARNYCVVCLCRGILIEGFQPGDTLKILLPAEPVINSSTGQVGNLGEGVYLIQKTQYIWEGNLLYTRLTLLQTKY